MSRIKGRKLSRRRLSVEAEHARTRERFLALYMIGGERVNATEWAAEIGRDNNTVKESAPVARGLPGWSWSNKKVQR